MYISVFEGSFTIQSVSFPGSELEPSGVFLVASLAFLAAIRARDAKIAFSIIARPTFGFSSRKSASFSFTMVSTRPRISELPSLVLV